MTNPGTPRFGAQADRQVDAPKLECEIVTVKNVKVSVDDAVHRRARIKAAEQGTSVSAAVRAFLTRWSGEETDFERRKRLQEEPINTIEAFRGGNRLPRDDIHDRALVRCHERPAVRGRNSR